MKVVTDTTLWSDVYSIDGGGKRGHFNVEVPIGVSMSLVAATTVTLALLSANIFYLVQWWRCCHRIPIPGTRHPLKHLPWTVQRQKHGSKTYFVLISAWRSGKGGINHLNSPTSAKLMLLFKEWYSCEKKLADNKIDLKMAIFDFAFTSASFSNKINAIS